MRILNVASLLLLSFFITNCSLDVSIEDMVADDFLKSSILATTRGVGDGQTSATVVLLLKNSDDSLVTNYTPDFHFVDNGGSNIGASGITYSACSATNQQGVSTCSFKSIEVGARRVMFNNIVIDLVGTVFFDPPSRNGTFLQIVNSGQIDENAGGYAVTSHVGSIFTGIVHSASGYTVITNSTAGITPVE